MTLKTADSLPHEVVIFLLRLCRNDYQLVLHPNRRQA